MSAESSAPKSTSFSFSFSSSPLSGVGNLLVTPSGRPPPSSLAALETSVPLPPLPLELGAPTLLVLVLDTVIPLFLPSSSARFTNSSMAATRFFISFMDVRLGFMCFGFDGLLISPPERSPFAAPPPGPGPAPEAPPFAPDPRPPPLGLSRSRALERLRERVRIPEPLRASLALGSRVLERDEGGRSLVYWLRPTRRVFLEVAVVVEDWGFRLAPLRCEDRGAGKSAVGGVETVEGGGGLEGSSMPGDSILGHGVSRCCEGRFTR